MYIAQYISKFQIDIESEQGGEGIKSFFDESEERIVTLVSFSGCSVSIEFVMTDIEPKKRTRCSSNLCVVTAQGGGRC